MTDTPKGKKRWSINPVRPNNGILLIDNALERSSWVHVRSLRTALNAWDERERIGCVCTPWQWSAWLQRWVIWHRDSMHTVYQLPKGSIGCPKCLRKIRSKETS